MGALLDEIEPVWDVHEYHETRVAAPPSAVWTAALALPADASRLMRGLMALRELPGRLGGRGRTARPRGGLLEAMQREGFTLLAERPGAEIVLGLAGRFWRLVPDRARLGGREDFERYAEPGSARASIDFRVAPLGGGGTRLSTETRVRCFGDATRKFRRYWRVIGPFSAWIRRDMLRLIKARAEASTPPRSAAS